MSKKMVLVTNTDFALLQKYGSTEIAYREGMPVSEIGFARVDIEAVAVTATSITYGFGREQVRLACKGA